MQYVQFLKYKYVQRSAAKTSVIERSRSTEVLTSVALSVAEPGEQERRLRERMRMMERRKQEDGGGSPVEDGVAVLMSGSVKSSVLSVALRLHVRTAPRRFAHVYGSTRSAWPPISFPSSLSPVSLVSTL